MRFFTPELYIRFNSSDDVTADRANEAWEKALAEYGRHLDTIRNKMPSQVRKIAELCLHDAEFLGLEQGTQSHYSFPEPFHPGPLWSSVAILSLKQDRTVRSLIYMLWDCVREFPAKKDWPFGPARKRWLYEEMDLAPDQRGAFLHRILFSDGSVVEIPFVSAIVSSVSLPATSDDGATRRIA